MVTSMRYLLPLALITAVAFSMGVHAEPQCIGDYNPDALANVCTEAYRPESYPHVEPNNDGICIIGNICPGVEPTEKTNDSSCAGVGVIADGNELHWVCIPVTL